MTTKKPLHKQIIVLIGSENIKMFITLSNNHVVNINQTLKNIKSNIIIDFICLNHRGLIFMSNKVAAPSDICIVSNYVKNTNNMNSEDVQNTYLLQSKLYFKILGLPYHIKNTNTPIDSNVIENIIKLTYIFNNIKVVSKL